MLIMFVINNRQIGNGQPPYLIAELSANHNGSLERAKHSIRIAKESGADAIKIQSYTPNTMTIDCDSKDFLISSGPWKGIRLFDLYKTAHTPFEWHKELFDYAHQLGITIFSTPFDETAVDLLESLNAPAYKIASFEITDLPLISYVAKKNKPMLISTGMATYTEIAEAIETARTNGCNSLLLFHCISSYPTPIEHANLLKLLKLRETFGVLVGLSDHTLGNVAAISSVALGACAIEKHFTISKADKGPDSEFSIEPKELATLSQEIKDVWRALGSPDFTRPASELTSKIFRRSIYFVVPLKTGDIVTRSSIRRIRPGFGLEPKYFEEIIGKTVCKDVNRGDAVTWDLIK
jgi:pseudaminic acid synthase